MGILIVAVTGILIVAVTALGFTMAVLRRARAGDIEPPGSDEASARATAQLAPPERRLPALDPGAPKRWARCHLAAGAQSKAAGVVHGDGVVDGPMQ